MYNMPSEQQAKNSSPVKIIAPPPTKIQIAPMAASFSIIPPKISEETNRLKVRDLEAVTLRQQLARLSVFL